MLEKLFRSEKGLSLIEVLVSLAIISVVAVGYLSAMTTSSRASIKADQMDTARTLAQGQMEYIKEQKFAASYTLDDAVFNANSNEFKDYPGYTVGAVNTDRWRIVPSTPANRDALIQMISITIYFRDKAIFTLEDCKVKR
jgi:prepilin-type N-terminal cleavage/methylation domain-containing protein